MKSKTTNNWKLKVIYNHFAHLLHIKYRFVFFYAGDLEDDELIYIKFLKVNPSDKN